MFVMRELFAGGSEPVRPDALQSSLDSLKKAQERVSSLVDEVHEAYLSKPVEEFYRLEGEIYRPRLEEARREEAEAYERHRESIDALRIAR